MYDDILSGDAQVISTFWEPIVNDKCIFQSYMAVNIIINLDYTKIT